MQALLTQPRFLVFCLGLSMIVVPASLAQNEMPSVLSRVQTVDDPELGELLRVALQRSGGVADDLRTVRAVTESYAQIKLLDRQIAQIQQRIQSGVGSADLRHELLLAAAELESKRIVELASLREAMGIIPEHAFGKRSVWNLRTWLELDVLDGTVHVIEHLHPFTEGQPRSEERYRSVGLMSRTETLDYIRQQLAKSNALPIRIDVRGAVEAVELSEKLQQAVIGLVKQAGREMQAEVHREGTTQQGPVQFYLHLSAGSPRVSVSQIGPGTYRSDSTSVDPNGLDAHLVEQFAKPGRLPAQIYINYPAALEDRADQVAKIVQGATQRLGLDKFVQVRPRVHEPDPEVRYVGRWRAIDRSEIVEVVIGRRPGAHITQVDASDSGETTYPAQWSGDSRQITIQAQQGPGRYHKRYNGYIDSEGHLILGIDDKPIAFERVE